MLGEFCARKRRYSLEVEYVLRDLEPGPAVQKIVAELPKLTRR
jgi:hypothetical protein